MCKLSVITICYNEPNLEKTCESIVNQTWQGFEWIVVDGGSNEETQKIWDKYKYRINKFVSEPDNGIYNACNKGINLASGEYINFMNAGDFFYSDNILERVFYRKNYIADVLYGDTCNFGRKKKYIDKKTKNFNKNFIIADNICTQSAFIKRNLFLKYGFFDERYLISADHDAWIRFFKNGAKFRHIGIVVSNFDMTGLSNTNKKLRRQENSEIMQKYYTNEEISKAKKIKSIKKGIREGLISIKKDMSEKIFSIKKSKDKRHKIVAILGIRIKIKRRNK